jgi:predicted ATPase
MLTELHLSNFKAWKELNMKLGRVTGLFGTNSSGKSSILQFLLMLKQTKNATDRGLVLDLGGQNQLINLGSFNDLIHKHQENLFLKWSISWKAQTKLFDTYTPVDFNTSVEVFLKNKEIKINFLSYEFLDYLFEIKQKNNLINEYEFKETIGKLFTNVKNSLFPPIKTHLFPDKIKSENTLSLFVGFEYEKMMDKIHYLGPLREYPKREYQWSGASPIDVGYRGEYAINAILSATFRHETRITPNSTEAKPFQEVIAFWLKELGLIQEFSIKEIAEGSNLYRAIVKRDQESPEAFLTDVGFGVSQVLPALVLLYYVPEGSTILMEQPEIHLHPSVQSGLADVILQVAKHRNIQVIVESHSEHLLRRFQRRIAEEQYPADELKLYFCNSIQGVSKLSDLDIDTFGEIRNWPENFFGDEMAEIAATRIAALKHKMRETAVNGG